MYRVHLCNPLSPQSIGRVHFYNPSGILLKSFIERLFYMYQAHSCNHMKGYSLGNFPESIWGSNLSITFLQCFKGPIYRTLYCSQRQHQNRHWFQNTKCGCILKMTKLNSLNIFSRKVNARHCYKKCELAPLATELVCLMKLQNSSSVCLKRKPVRKNLTTTMPSHLNHQPPSLPEVLRSL